MIFKPTIPTLDFRCPVWMRVVDAYTVYPNISSNFTVYRCCDCFADELLPNATSEAPCINCSTCLAPFVPEIPGSCGEWPRTIHVVLDSALDGVTEFDVDYDTGYGGYQKIFGENLYGFFTCPCVDDPSLLSEPTLQYNDGVSVLCVYTLSGSPPVFESGTIVPLALDVGASTGGGACSITTYSLEITW